MTQPKDVCSEPGKEVRFIFKTFPVSTKYQWCFEENKIRVEDKDYTGSATEHLLLKKFLPKHKGYYKCIATDVNGHSVMSNVAVLESSKILFYSNIY